MDQLAPFRRYFRYAAIACSLASAVMTAWFGFQQNPYWVLAGMCALFLVACSLASDYIVLFVVDAWKGDNRIMAGVVALGAVFVFSLNLLSNLGAVGWQRDVTSTAAKVQNTRHEDGRDTVTDFAKRAASFEDRAKQLDAEMQALVTTKVSGWTVATRPASPEELDGQIAAKQLEVDNEAKRTRCGPKCEQRTNELAHLKSLRAKAAEIAKNNEMHAAALQGLANARNASAMQTKVVAAPTSQALFFASMAQIDLKPSEEAQTWTDRGLATWLALGLCIAPMLFSLLGWRSDDDIPTASAPVTKPAKAQPIEKPSALETFQAAYRRESERMGVQPLRIAA
jgi:hypothetical protein